MIARALLWLAALAAPGAASASILTGENAGQLCVAMPDGRRAVDPDRLAMLVASPALPFLDGANPSGTTNGTVELRSTGDAPSEAVYAVIEADRVTPAEANRPFGPQLDLALRPDAMAARDAIVAAMKELSLFLEQGSRVAGLGLTYRAVPLAAGTRLDGDPTRFFGPRRTAIILCEQGTAPAPSTLAEGKEVGQGASIVHFRLRGTAADLVSTARLKNVAPATISFSRDAVAEKSTFGINAVAGLAVTPGDGRFSLVPYLSYERSAVTGGDDNIEKLSPGLLGGLYLEGPSAALHAKLELSYIADFEQHARQGKLRLYLEPAFKLGGGQGVLFGSYLFRGPLRIRPDVTGIIDVSRIYDRGTSEALRDAKSYAGFGGQAEIRAYLDVDSWLSDLTLVAGGRQLFMTGAIEQDSINRWWGSLEYASDALPNLGFGFSFTRGENDDTFQRQEIYQIGLKLRY